MVLLSGRLFGGINHQVITAGAAIEMLHNASLIHDDVIDQSKQRRGVDTINGVWDNHVAVLVGEPGSGVCSQYRKQQHTEGARNTGSRPLIGRD